MIDPDALDGVLLPEQQVQVRGHSAAIAGVEQQLHSGRLPGAMLLHGPQGIGKATLAFQLARTILTATGDEDGHRVSEQIASGAHPNVRVLRRAPKDAKGFYTVIRVDEVRELRARLQQTRGRQGQRIAIVDSIDDCNPSAANALLKTLEEPPADTTFFLISHRPGQLLPTIRSRCHSIALRPIADGDVRDILLAQRPELTMAELDRAIALAGGRPRRAFETLSLSEQSALGALNAWLQEPTRTPAAVHLQIADALGADTQSTELSFAREMITDFLADEARNAALSGARMRLASANELWDKAQGLFVEADSINLDMKQTLIAIFDAIRKHIQTTAPLSTEPL
ncbi:AAA family ATPase [Devosia sp.]|uniref:AAA family ATPase n=1 Tax=Devosia sp. TaxID=1871048 RepID=UPI003265E709